MPDHRNVARDHRRRRVPIDRRDACDQFARTTVTDAEWAPFAEMLTYVPTSEGPERLASTVAAAEELSAVSPGDCTT